MKNICVYASSSCLLDDIYLDTAFRLGGRIAQKGYGIVFGAGTDGLMGALARGAAEQGGALIGVIPEMMNVKEIIFEHCTQLHVTRTMRERKALMEEKADAFIALPGGFGTFEEILEIIAFKQLGCHQKPVAFFNVNGYYDALIAQFDEAVCQQFTAKEALSVFGVYGNIDEMLNDMETDRPAATYKKNELMK